MTTEIATTAAPVSNGKVRTPPKQLARERASAFALKAGSFADRLRGFGVDDQLRTILSSLAEIEEKIGSLPEDYKPKRGAGAGRILGSGRVYRIKPKYIERYERLTGAGNAAACIYDRDLDDKTALCSFVTEGDAAISLQVPKNHLGKEAA